MIITCALSTWGNKAKSSSISCLNSQSPKGLSQHPSSPLPIVGKLCLLLKPMLFTTAHHCFHSSRSISCRESGWHSAPGQWRKGRRANCSPGLITHHSRRAENISPHRLHRATFTSVAIAKTASPNHHLIQSIVVFIEGIIFPPSKQGVPKGMEFGKVYPQIC